MNQNSHTSWIENLGLVTDAPRGLEDVALAPSVWTAVASAPLSSAEMGSGAGGWSGGGWAGEALRARDRPRSACLQPDQIVIVCERRFREF